MPRPARRPAGRPAEPVRSSSQDPAPRVWQGVQYRPSQTGGAEVRRLFDFAGAWAPPSGPGELVWEALTDERTVGGILVERHGADGFVHGPVVVEPPASTEPLEVAAQLVAPVLGQAAEQGVDTLFTRPQGLDRIWIRFGFIPLPESTLPPGLTGRPGAGLYAWRGGSALWSLREAAEA